MHYLECCLTFRCDVAQAIAPPVLAAWLMDWGTLALQKVSYAFNASG